jgi:hypothetical protein
LKVYILAADANRYQNLTWSNEQTRRQMWERFRGVPIGHSWESPLVEVVRDAKQNKDLLPGDFPSLGGHAPTFSQNAVEVLGDFLSEAGQVLPLRSDEGVYFVVNVTKVVDALDEEASEIKRFPDGRIMRIVRHQFKPDRLHGIAMFKLPQAPQMYTYVTDQFVERVRDAGLTGFQFREA